MGAAIGLFEPNTYVANREALSAVILSYDNRSATSTQGQRLSFEGRTPTGFTDRFPA